MISIVTGLASGAAHVLTGPDHLAAIAPLAMERPKHALRVGLRWGAGHATGVLALAAVGMAARSQLDVGQVAMWAEASVGVLLVAIGLWALRKARGVVVHAHGHDHGADEDHRHVHVHVPGVDHAAPEAHHGHSHAPFLIGVLHGTAGTGHLLGLLPSLALPPAQAVAYLGAYLVAGVVVMSGVTWLLGSLSMRGSRRTLAALMYGSATLAIGLGVFWIVTATPAFTGA